MSTKLAQKSINWMNEALDRADKSNDVITKGDKYVRTPWTICEEIVGQIVAQSPLQSKKILVVDTVEFIPVLLAFGAEKCNITFVAPYEYKGASIAGVIGVRVVQQSLLEWKPDMKFDVVVGNPPYQDGRDKLFYQKFVNRAYEMSDDVVAMITPAGWTSIADLKTSFCKNIINNGILVYKRLKETAFGNVQVSTVYFISSKISKSNNVSLSALNDSIIIPRADIPYFPVETTAGISIIEKIRLRATHGLHSKSGGVWRNEAKVVDSALGIKCIFSAGKKNEDFDWAYVDPTTVLGNFGKHKVIVSHVTQYGILGNLKYASPEYGVASACHSMPVENKEEGKNLISYLETKFVKFIVRTLKGSVKSNSHSLFAAIPNVGFSRLWTDSELYAHFGLTQEEIDYIEATVK